MREQIETRALPCDITDDERDRFASESSNLVFLIRKAQDEGKIAAAERKTEIQTMQDRLEEVAQIHRTGKEVREVEVKTRFALSRGIAMIIRADTGDCVEERPMTMAEKQLSMDLPPMGLGRREEEE